MNLHAACIAGDVDFVKKMLELGAVDLFGFGLNAACEGGHLDIVKLLFERDTDRRIDRDSAVQNARTGGDWEVIQFVMVQGANNWNGALRGACQNDSLKLVNFLIQQGANDWNFGLIYACTGGNLQIAKITVAQGANKWKAALREVCLSDRLSDEHALLLRKSPDCCLDVIHHAQGRLKTDLQKIAIFLFSDRIRLNDFAMTECSEA